jgi:hypothetical protein
MRLSAGGRNVKYAGRGSGSRASAPRRYVSSGIVATASLSSRMHAKTAESVIDESVLTSIDRCELPNRTMPGPHGPGE